MKPKRANMTQPIAEEAVLSHHFNTAETHLLTVLTPTARSS